MMKALIGWGLVSLVLPSTMAVAAEQDASSPPPPVRVSPPPPIVAPAARSELNDEAAIPVSVRIERDSALVWAGMLRVGSPYGNASFTQSKVDYAEPCEEAARNRGERSNERLNFTIGSVRGEPTEQFQINLDLTWTTGACGGGTSSVGLRRTVTVKPGGKVREEGEGGVSVTLMRSK
ncbi:hypothetical protein MB02_12785 [Croceicoccus estronivorus]|uniref:hypothetical protein n=1 Tax=Croceicoccus estronivorus TaxID=1172626 RepID=UPI00082C068E|nr:hypothetical protein [Croceicoccus estronivorus]OCC23050.1 hypothetical protein MB02_12785 [Croceicoccus estronivorus]